MIRDKLVDAVRAALDRAGFPAPDGGIDPRRRPSSPSTATGPRTSRSRSAKPAGRPAPRRRGPRSSRRSRPIRPAHVERVEVAGPGVRQPPPGADVAARGAPGRGRGGRAVTATGQASPGSRINLEFVSANPTGPLHAGGGRWVAVGDALANLLAAQGAEVHREYYLNDAGNQLDLFGASLLARYDGRDAAGRRLPGRVPRRDGRPDAGRARRRRHRGAGDASGDTATSMRQLQRRPRAASACTSTRGSRSGPCTSAARSRACSTRSATRGATFERRRRDVAAHHRLRRPARSRAREVRRLDHVPVQRPRVPRGQVRPGLGRTSSTSGAPTTTAR